MYYPCLNGCFLAHDLKNTIFIHQTQTLIPMPTGGPFPTRDAALNNYFLTAIPYLSNHAMRLNISPEEQEAINVLLKKWNDAYPASTNADLRTKTITHHKNTAKQELQAKLRHLFADIPQSTLTVEDRNTLNLKERASAAPAPVPSTCPIARVDTSMRLQHTIHFKDVATPHSKAKPPRVRGCQIWMKIGSAPVSAKELGYLATDTRSPHIAHHDGEDAGKPVYYMLRWENSRGETGPWSETVMATITA
jgi:hypothetical protein